MSALECIRGNYYKIIKANLTNDTFRIIQIDESQEIDLHNAVEYEKGLTGLWNSYAKGADVFHEDKADFDAYVNLSFVSEFFKKYHGEELYEVQFRRRVQGEFQPVHLEIVAADDYSDEQQNVYILIKRYGQKLYSDYVHFSDMLRGLSENYGAIYYVDFDKDEIQPFRISPAVEAVLGDFLKSKPPYEAAIHAYIRAVVAEKDQEEMYAVTQYDFLKEQLKNVLAYSHEYRVLRGGREFVFRFKAANLEGIGELHKAVVGFADVSAEKAQDFSVFWHGKKILIVDDSDADRQALEEILSEHYEVVTATNGEEALQILDTSFQDIALVVTDLSLPVMDGYELIKQMKRIRQYSLIPIVVSTDSGIYETNRTTEIEVICLDLGANDFVLKPYNADIVLNRVKSIIQLRESTRLLNSLEKDSLTGLYAKEFFYQRVEQQIKDFPNENYIMWVSDIQGLKLINDKYGIEMGDEVIKLQASKRDAVDGFILGGRIEGDKLAALVTEASLPSIYKLTEKADLGLDFPVPNVVIKHGIYPIRRNSTLAPQGMFDRALLAMQKIKDTYGVYLAEYDDALRKDLLVQRLVAENADIALAEHQFVVYFQPKFDLHNAKTNGAEALVRWIHPDLGFMNPGLFIPLFEQNGFIQKVDYYVWEEVCRALVDWQEKGLRLVPISVNVSRRDFEDENLANNVIALIDKYGIDHKYFHIEVTESAYSDNPQKISETIKKFHDNGFIVELDDFGAGYSSMSALSELDLDIMKLDMSLIRNDDPNSSKSVLEFSMQLAKMMQLKTVAEGVETEAQVDRISSLGGDYIQGYFYSKPLSKEQFETYMMNEENKK